VFGGVGGWLLFGVGVLGGGGGGCFGVGEVGVEELGLVTSFGRLRENGRPK